MGISFFGTKNQMAINDSKTDTGGILSMGTLRSTTTWLALGTTAERVGVKLAFKSTAATGTAWGVQIRMRADAAGGGAVGLNVSASNNIAATGGLQAIQGYAQPHYAIASAAIENAIVAIYGKTWPDPGLQPIAPVYSLWIDNGCNVKSSGGHWMARFSNNAVNTTGGGGVIIDGLFTIYQGTGMAYFLNVENAIGGGFLNDTDTAKTNAAGSLAVRTPAGVRYITLYT